MRILIKEPREVLTSQTALQLFGNFYENCVTRKSSIDSKTIVLDVRLPIVAFYELDKNKYIVVEGHTRFYEATRQNVGIEAELVKNLEELTNCPEECFRTLDINSCKFCFMKLSFAHEYAKSKGIVCIGDLFKSTQN